MRTERSPEWRRSIGQGLIGAGLLLQTSIALRILAPDTVSPETAHRLLGAAMGMLVIAYANVAPKVLSPLAGMRCDPVAEQATRRFAGWILTLGGLAYTAASLLAPAESADGISASLLGASVLVVIIRIATRRTQASGS